jgi:hypothetical protein
MDFVLRDGAGRFHEGHHDVAHERGMKGQKLSEPANGHGSLTSFGHFWYEPMDQFARKKARGWTE